MKHSQADDNLVNRIWNLFSSMRFGITLILVFSGLLALATILSPISGSDTIYSSPLFLLIVGLLIMNLIICTINRINMLISFTNPKTSLIKKEDPGKMPLGYGVTVGIDRSSLERQVHRFFHSRGFRIKKIKEGEKSFFYLSKGSLGPRCSLLLHLSLVIVVAGVLWGGMTKVETKVTIPEGYTGDLSRIKEIKFNIRLDDFTTLYDEQGNVSNWVSRVSIISDDEIFLDRGETKVNHPLNYHGFNLYQHSYGQAIKMQLRREKNDSPQSMVLSQDQYYHHLSQLGGLGLWVGRYHDRQVPYKFFDGTSEVSKGYLHQGDSVKLPGENDKHLQLAGTIPFSVIQVKRDPGIPVVFTGLTLMAVSFFGTTLIRQRRYWAKIQSGCDGEPEFVMGGLKQGRNHNGEVEFNKLTGELESALDSLGEEENYAVRRHGL